MLDWNVVVSVAPRRYQQACELLKDFGKVQRTDYYNVVVVRVDDVLDFLDTLHRLADQLPACRQYLTRVIPISHAFSFQSPDEFETKTRQTVAGLAMQLFGKSFHVRMQRRGFKGQLSSQEEEQLLGHFLIEQVRAAGGETHIDFADPDLIIALESVGQRAGLSFWSRAQLQRYPLLKIC